MPALPRRLSRSARPLGEKGLVLEFVHRLALAAGRQRAVGSGRRNEEEVPELTAAEAKALLPGTRRGLDASEGGGCDRRRAADGEAIISALNRVDDALAGPADTRVHA